MKNKKVSKKSIFGFTHIFLLIIIVLIGIAGVGYFAYQNGQINIPLQNINSISPTPKSISDDISDWRTYSNTDYSIKYPRDYNFYENQTMSVDGVIKQTPGTNQIVSPTISESNSNFIISIKKHKDSYPNLEEGVDNSSTCDEVSSENGVSKLINGLQALVFENSPCGPWGSTLIYLINDQTLYEISIETSANYEEILPFTYQILSTFKFTD